MLDGVILSLLAGPGVVFPVPAEVIGALQRATVSTSTAVDSGFELTFGVSAGSPVLATFLLAGSSLPPILRVVLAVTVNGIEEVLIDGVVTRHQMASGAGGGMVLTLQGTDLTALMSWDLVSTEGVPFVGMPPEARVALLLAKYAVLGITPIVIPSVLLDVPIPTHHIPVQQGNDLEYIRGLAEEVGYVFYIDPGPTPGRSRAYWGPEIKVGPAQPALTLDMGVAQNVESLQFSVDGEKKRLPVVWYHNELTKAPIPIPIPDITPLSPPLGLVPPIPRGVTHLVGTGRLSPVRSALIGLALAARNSEAVFADGALDVARYGRVLKARQLAGVRGAGAPFDGLYYVSAVTHHIERGSYRQDFKLSRNGLLSTVRAVPA